MDINKITTQKLDSKIRFVKITPARAEELLQHNYHKQRKLQPKVVDRYTSDMLSGRFQSKMLGQPLMAEWDLKTGRLIYFLDGQHRLHAVVKSGTTQVFLLVWETHEKFEYIDNGSKRETKDFISRSNAGAFSALVDKVIRLKKNDKGSAISTIASRSESTRNEILDFEKANPELSDNLETLLRGAEKVRKNIIKKGGSQAGIAALGWMLSVLGVDDHWTQFCDDCGKIDPDSAAIRAFARWKQDELNKNTPTPNKDKGTLAGVLWMYDNFKGWRRDRKFKPEYAQSIEEKYNALWAERIGGKHE